MAARTTTSSRHPGPARPAPRRALRLQPPFFARRPGAGASPAAPGNYVTSALLAVALLAAACGPPRPLTPQVSYDYFCARCHGADGRGDPDAVSLNPKLDLLRSEMVVDGDRELVRQRIVQGKGSMPGFRDKLEPHEIDELVTYTLERFRRRQTAAEEIDSESH